jgi:UDP-2,4-diacetamido-2,4,6-trideoxy-beta-L-altropyranose hydrolase
MTDAGHIELRRAALADMELVFTWRNDPFVVARSSSRRTVEWTEHHAWFTRAIESTDPMIFIVEIGQHPIGQVRLERAASDCIISVYLLECHTGHGYGVLAIREGCALARQEWSVGRVIACVRNDNAAGALGFTKARFRACAQDRLCPERHRCFVFDEWDAHAPSELVH